MVLITVLVALYLAYTGYTYYNTPIIERYYHDHHDWFKPSGPYGHGLGIVGTLMILFGVVIYIARKRYNFLAKFIRLKYLLEFHIFLCTLGPILILFHTAFKFGGIVSVAFWSMVAVVLSGVIGRFIYIQIPRTIEGRALSLNEVKLTKSKLEHKLINEFELDEDTMHFIVGSNKKIGEKEKTSLLSNYLNSKKVIRTVQKALKAKNLTAVDRKSVLQVIKDEISIANKIERLELMQKLFKYWHVAHLPFALIMLIIVIVHVAVTLAFGYKWIF